VALSQCRSGVKTTGDSGKFERTKLAQRESAKTNFERVESTLPMVQSPLAMGCIFQ
jgi:hypothetical protein